MSYEQEKEWARQEWQMDIDDDTAAMVTNLLAFQGWRLHKAWGELWANVKKALGI